MIEAVLEAQSHPRKERRVSGFTQEALKAGNGCAPWAGTLGHPWRTSRQRPRKKMWHVCRMMRHFCSQSGGKSTWWGQKTGRKEVGRDGEDAQRNLDLILETLGSYGGVFEQGSNLTFGL